MSGSKQILPSIDEALLLGMLEAIDQKQRLLNCGLVSRTWHAASLAATTCVAFKCSPESTASFSLAAWLLKHGMQVEKLSLECDVSYYQGLKAINLCKAFQQLHKLSSCSIEGINVDLELQHDEASSLNPLATVSSTLTSLTLKSAQFSGLPDGWSSLSVLTSLQELELQKSRMPQLAERSYRNYWGKTPYLGEALQRLTALTKLKLYDQDLSSDDRMAIGSCWQLRWLIVKAEPPQAVRNPYADELIDYPETDHSDDDRHSHRQTESESDSDSASLGYHRRRYRRLPAPCNDFMQLPPRLTRLEMLCSRLSFNNTTLPHLRNLRHLQHLHLEGHNNCDPRFLHKMEQLTHLQLNMRCDGFNVPGLLGSLMSMQQLQHLGIAFNDYTQPSDAMIAALSEQGYALLSSTQLTCLELTNVPLPPGAVGKMFRIAGLEQNLQKIQMKGLYGFMKPFIGTSDLYSLTRCCPALKQLNLTRALQDDAGLTSLVQLADLHTLQLSGGSVNDHAFEHALAKMFGLRTLEIEHGKFTVEGFMQLTHLTGLQRLTLDRYCCIFNGALHDDDEGPNIEFTTADPRTQSLWLNLDQYHYQPELDTGGSGDDAPPRGQRPLHYWLGRNPDYLHMHLRLKEQELHRANNCIQSLERQLADAKEVSAQ